MDCATTSLRGLRRFCRAVPARLATVAKFGLHALRHACASLWIEQGHNPKQIQKLMGHSSIKVTFDVYGHLFADNEQTSAPPKMSKGDCSGLDLARLG